MACHQISQELNVLAGWNGIKEKAGIKTGKEEMKCPKCDEYIPWKDSIVLPLKERIMKILVLAKNQQVSEHELWEILDADMDAIRGRLSVLEEDKAIHRTTYWSYWSEDEDE